MEDMKEFYTALAKAQAKIKPAIADTTNPFFKSKYAPLSSIWEACIGPLTEEGFSIMEIVDTDATGNLFLVTSLCHKSGTQVSTKYPIRPVKMDPQGYGSAITYARRYSLAPLVGVVIIGEDDDGAAASNTKTEPVRDTSFITKEQGDSIWALIKDNDKIKADLFKHFKIAKLGEIKKCDYQGVINWVNVFAKEEASPYDK